jgi:ATP-binding cassette subfamily B protein
MRGFMDESQLIHRSLSRFDRFMLRILHIGELPVHELKDGGMNATNVLELYFEQLKRFPVAIALSVIGVIIGSVSSILTPYIFKLFLDILAEHPTELLIGSLMHYVVLLLIVNLASWVGWRTSFLSMAYLASHVTSLLRQKAFQHLVKHSHRFFSSSFTGSLVQKVNRFAGSYDRLADRFVFDIVPIVVQVIGIMYVLYEQHHIIALIILVWLIIFVTWNYVFAQWKLKFDISRAAQDSRTTGQLADSITNQQTIELYRSYDSEVEQYNEATKLQSLYARFSWQSSNLIDGVQALFVIAVEFIMLYVGVQLWSKGELTIGTFVLLQSYVVLLSDRLWSFSRVIRDVYESFADAKEMAEIIHQKHEIKESVDAVDLVTDKGMIEFRHVSFLFHDKMILNDLQLSIKAGEKVALVGKSGAGKTTITRLLFRQYDPQKGSVLIDGVNIAKVTLESLGNALSMVPQEPMLFNRTLLENIRYGRPDASDEEVYAAAKLAHCHEFIISHPAGYASLVGDQGDKPQSPDGECDSQAAGAHHRQSAAAADLYGDGY